METREYISGGSAILGLELGSTRIKATLIGSDHYPDVRWGVKLVNGNVGHENGILTASLSDVSLSGSNADYSPLIGSVFSSTDLLGLLSSSANSWDYYGVFDNFSVSKNF